MNTVRPLGLTLLLILALALALPACDETTGTDDETPTEQLDPDLVESWMGTRGVFTSDADPSRTFDLITDGGTYLLFEFSDDGTVELVELETVTDRETRSTGTWTTVGSNLILDLPDIPDTVGYAIDGEILTITSTDETFDFDGDGTEEPASLEVRLGDWLDLVPDTAVLGTWNSTAWEFISKADPSTSVDMMNSGASFSVTFSENTTSAADDYVATITMPGDTGMVTEVEEGIGFFFDETLYISPSVPGALMSILTYEIDRSGGVTTATVTQSYDESFDFDEDGVEEPAIMRLWLSRQ